MLRSLPTRERFGEYQLYLFSQLTINLYFTGQNRAPHLASVVEKARHRLVTRQLLSYKGLTHSDGKWAGFSGTPRSNSMGPEGSFDLCLQVDSNKRGRMSCSSLPSPGAAASWLLWCAQHSLGLAEPPAPGLSSALFPNVAFKIWRIFVGLIHVFPRKEAHMPFWQEREDREHMSSSGSRNKTL